MKLRLLIFLVIIFAVTSLYYLNNQQKVIELTALISSSQILPPITPPKKIKAIYVTAQVAANPNRVNNLINFLEKTELNSLVINVKDGESVFLNKWMADLVRQLREKNIYPIARIAIFQDNYFAQLRPDLALKTSDGKFWGKKGYLWLDPSNKEVWDFNVDTALKALKMGFAEINFDYVRFPDGNADDIVYPFYDYNRLKSDIINEAAGYITKKIKTEYPKAIISLDVFAYTFLRTDIGIGQKLIDLADNFDVIAPMIYPSHYIEENFGFKNPAEHPYDVVFKTLSAGLDQLKKAGKGSTVIRPWIQDFNLGAVYDREKIQAQIKAIDDQNLSGWMIWNPNNIYLESKYKN